MVERINASCTVDDLGYRQFEVRVWGQPPFDHERVYTLSALCDNSAAQAGISKFVEEMENLRDAAMKDS